MKYLLIVIFLIASPVFADGPVFLDRSDSNPTQRRNPYSTMDNPPDVYNRIQRERRENREYQQPQQQDQVLTGDDGTMYYPDGAGGYIDSRDGRRLRGR